VHAAGDQAHEDLRRGRELEAEAARVAAGQDGGARRRAGGVVGVAGGELHAAARDRVDVRRRHDPPATPPPFQVRSL
jgi:hypothetical protein